MLQNLFREQLEDCPVIAAARDLEGLAHCCQSESGIVFILFGDVRTISEIIDQVKSAGKLAFVHMDLVNDYPVGRLVWILSGKKRGRMESFPPSSRRSAGQKNLAYITVHRFLSLIPLLMKMWKMHKSTTPGLCRLMRE